MATDKQKLGDWGEKLIKKFDCFKCKHQNTLKQLPPNFKCADIICDFCGYLAQVKTKQTKNIDKIPKRILGAAWGPQKERMDSGIYFPLFLILKNDNNHSIFYLSSDLQTQAMFIKRKKLSDNAKRAGWQGYYFDGEIMKNLMTRIV
tara:strand:- start:236 stop:676 length:441 start_codon:yes stop_codon:yes gene_type:complete